MKRRMQDARQPFAFTKENAQALEAARAKYPDGRDKSAVMEALHLVQAQEGWVSREAIEVVAGLLHMTPLQVWEVASFYTMYNLAPKGKHHLQVCTTTPCWLRGSDAVLATCEEKAAHYGPDIFQVCEVECLGGCVNAPLVQINNDVYEDLDAAATAALLDALAAGKEPPFKDSALRRQGSAPHTPSKEGNHA
ncbi:MAG: NAD(P)H-dependent oxidoreductase subunit E [Candidatus Puniceispirillum sp.]|nr:NAD(P)H-dependent oxidoreductase subunit E [Candidatus Puniceispirillum sp.]